jgi:hypothetical protein
MPTRSFRFRRVLVQLIGILGSLASYSCGGEKIRSRSISSEKLLAVVVITEGRVTVKSASNLDWRPLQNGAALEKGDRIMTHSNASARIRFSDGALVDIRPETLIVIEGLSPYRSSRQVEISDGEVRLNGQELSVKSPVLESMIAESTTAKIVVAKKGATEVHVFSGGAKVRTARERTVHLGDRQSLLVDAKGRAGQILALPEAPMLVFPRDGAQINYPDPVQATTVFTWNANPGVAAFRFQIDDQASFASPINDLRSSSTLFELRGLEPGFYFWRVSALTAKGLESDFSPSARFAIARSSVRQLAREPRLSIDMLEIRGRILFIKGRTEPNALVSVNQAAIDVQSDGGFSEHVTLDLLQRDVVIRVMTTDGRTRTQTHAVEDIPKRSMR